MQTDPRVAVIVPAYQAEATLGRAMESVLAQTFSAWEMVVVDDGSTDATADVAHSYDDPRIRLLQQSNTGQPGARNAGIAAARAPLVAFLDADDAWLPDKLTLQLPTCGPMHVSSTDCEVVDTVSGRTARYSTIVEPMPDGVDPLAWLLCEGNSIAVLTVIVPTDAVRALGGFDARFPGVEDFDLWIRLAQFGCTFSQLAVVAAQYYVQPTSMSSDTARMLATEAAVADNARQSLDHTPYARFASRRRDHLLAMTVVLDRTQKPFGDRGRDLAKLLAHRPKAGALATQLLFTLSPAALAKLRPRAVAGRGFENRRAV
jgi:glycosyltransferase involved in cell wall biosynthesis